MIEAITRSLTIKRLGACAGALIVLVGILDVISTNLVLVAGGSELNPLVAWMMDHLGAWWLLPKLLAHVVTGFLLYHLLNSRLTAVLAFLVIAVYGAVLHHNFSLVLTA
jgi:hypothetical protein